MHARLLRDHGQTRRFRQGDAMSDSPTSLAEPAPERGSRQRQRQRLIDACIAALHIHGPSRTTVEKVVALAGLSPGIVRFYFDSKDALLIASLAYLAAEFEERVMVPVGQLRETPVRALERLVELYLDPEIASPRKVSVWYSFWGEASARQEYQDICGRKDDDFAALVLDLMQRLIAETGRVQLDADAIALGLIGVLEVLWQTIAFQEESELDREAARTRSMAYLGSVFPGQFPASATRAAHEASVAAPMDVPVGGAAAVLPGSAYDDAALFSLERERVLRPAWQLLAHRSEIERAGDYLARDVGAERVLLVRDERGQLHAYRNACPHRPHALLNPGRGHLDGSLDCCTHGLRYGLDGQDTSKRGAPPLVRLQLHMDEALLWVRSPLGATSTAPAIELPAGWKALELEEREAGADWKLIVEQWLEASAAPSRQIAANVRHRHSRRRGAQSPSASKAARDPIARSVLPPNQLLEHAARFVQIVQLVPRAPGRTRLQCFRYVAGREVARAASAASEGWLAEQIALAESTQVGLALEPSYTASGVVRAPAGDIRTPALDAFRRTILSLLTSSRHA